MILVRRKVTLRSGDNKIEINFLLIAQKHRKYIRDVKVFPGELQHGLVLTWLKRK